MKSTFTWEQRKLGDLAEIVGGGTPSTSKEEYWDGEIDWYAPAEIGNQIYVDSSERKITEEGYSNCSAKILPVGTVLFTSRAGIGKMAILRKEACTNQGFQSIVPHESELNSYFIFSRSEELKRYGETVGAGSTFVEVSGKQMAAMSLMMPPTMDEQKKIGEYFANLDNLIALHQRKSFNIFKILITWEQRKLSELITEYKETVDSNCTLPVLTSSKTEGVVLQEDHFGNKQKHDISGYNILPRNYCTYRNRSDGVDFTFNINKCCDIGIISKFYPVFCGNNSDIFFISLVLNNDEEVIREIGYTCKGTGQKVLSFIDLQKMNIRVPSYDEQKKISAYFTQLNNLITLHQRVPPISIKEDLQMQETIVKTDVLFCDYYKQWIDTYKKGAIRDVTMDKYNMAYEWLKKLVPDLYLSEITRTKYQQLLNEYAEKHEHQTTMDFHHHIKCALLDAVDEGLLERDPTRKAIIKGKEPSKKKIKFLNQFELQKLLGKLDLGPSINWDWFILLIAKTGLRFSEALALTPVDFDFSHQMLSINKTWNYKGNGGFLPTKNKSSVRKIQLDWMTVMQFTSLLKELPEDKPIFITENAVYNSTVNDLLERRCKAAEVPVISIHGLRHTHASQLLFAGVSIASVARRLGHSSMTTTQKTYLHIIQELENKDIDLIMRSLSGLN